MNEKQDLNDWEIFYFTSYEEFNDLLVITGLDTYDLIKGIKESTLSPLDIKNFYLCVGRFPLPQELHLIQQFSVSIFCEFFSSGYRLNGVVRYQGKPKAPNSRTIKKSGWGLDLKLNKISWILLTIAGVIFILIAFWIIGIRLLTNKINHVDFIPIISLIFLWVGVGYVTLLMAKEIKNIKNKPI